ncbi:MAG: ParB/RepB/Spo0J family partition protein [Endomicrobium sp.]|nr:ParB/RepB/Spo0J family partition protein [Endomicrobium sp.]
MRDRIASTIRHNGARGNANVDLMSKIIAELVEIGRDEIWISKHLDMSSDDILRLKQITGLASLFKNSDFSKSWNVDKARECQ